MAEFLSKLSTARGAERSRVWLEGKRLEAHGFRHGATYSGLWARGVLILTVDPEGNRRVAGTPTRPIIDITGEAVRVAFGANAYVKVNSIQAARGRKVQHK